MFPTLSIISSVKDYVEITHKLIESDVASPLETYNNLGSMLSYIILIGKQFFVSFFSFQWFYQIYSLSITIPTIASSMVSEISVLDAYFHNAFTFLEKPYSYGDQNLFFYAIEKFTLGFINSFFLFLPTSTSSLISLRRFVVQGIEAGYLSGLGTLLGSLAWIASILFGWRFILLPWISLDVLRYSLGFLLLVKYMWDSYTERRTVLDNLAKLKMVFFTFLLAFTEQTSLFPFLTNISIGSDASLLESFPVNHVGSFFIIHICYLLGIGLGGLSLLYFTCWFWENPAFRFYTWALSYSNFQNFSNSFDTKEGKTKSQSDASLGILNGRLNYKFLNFTFLYLTMICAMSNIVYFGVDSILTKPLGFVTNDRLIDQKTLPETSFLSTKSSDRNTRMNMGRRGRRERWKKGLQRYRNFDASLYGQGIYDLFTIEDLNYGFDRFWLRRKMRNHDVPFRLFPGPWVRSFKKQLSRPRLESFSGPRLEFFRILFEQVYHPVFHEKKNEVTNLPKVSLSLIAESLPLQNVSRNEEKNLRKKTETSEKRKYIQEISVLQKFLRKVTKRLKVSKIASSTSLTGKENGLVTLGNGESKQQRTHSLNPFFPNLWKGANDLRESLLAINSLSSNSLSAKKNKILPFDLIYSKRWKELFGKINHSFTALTKQQQKLKQEVLFKKLSKVKNRKAVEANIGVSNSKFKSYSISHLNKKKSDFGVYLAKKDQQVSKYRTFLTQFNSVIPTGKGTLPLHSNEIQTGLTKLSSSNKKNLLEQVGQSNQTDLSFFNNVYKPLTLLHPIKFYLHREKALQRKFKFYGANIFRSFGISNNAPYFRIMMKKFFYYYKPTLRWERTMRVATLKKIRRKGARKPLRINFEKSSLAASSLTSLPSLPFPFPFPAGEGEREREREREGLSTLDNGSLHLVSEESVAKTEGGKNTEPKPSKQGLTESNKQLKTNQTSLVIGETTLSQSIKPSDSISSIISQSQQGLQKPTHMYSLIGKRATRYRFQIFKDVLQHWYYSPFNRLLLKLDIDAFIRRQPISHFLTKTEEHLLHLRRALLLDHYETLRWYTYMQHYRVMQTQIGGTKSFASRFYNQQFQGTFKKIRHLFSLTPNFSSSSLFSQTDFGGEKSYSPTILKWDQPLYNEYSSQSNSQFLNDIIVHEELLTDNQTLPKRISKEQNERNSLNPLSLHSSLRSLASPKMGQYEENLKENNQTTKNLYSSNFEQPLLKQTYDIINNSKQIISKYLIQANPIRQEIISKYLHEKNYWELTQFLFNGQKTRGILAATNESILLNQEKENLFTQLEKRELEKNEQTTFKELIQDGHLKEKLWLSLLKRTGKDLSNRKALKNYLKNKTDKLKKRKKIRQKQLKTRLERIKNWLASVVNLLDTNNQQKLIGGKVAYIADQSNQNILPKLSISRGSQKALKEAIQIQKKIIQWKRPLWGKMTPVQVNNMPKIFERHLLEKKLETSLENISILIQKKRLAPSERPKIQENLKLLKNKTLFWSTKPFKKHFVLSLQNNEKLPEFKKIILRKKNFVNMKSLNVLKIFQPKEEKDIEFWKKKQYVLSKRKQTRKILKQLKKQTNRINTGLAKTNQLLQNFERFEPKSKKEEKINVFEKSSSKELWNSVQFTKDFQTRRARKRIGRISRNRGIIKKPTLTEKFRNQVQTLKEYPQKLENSFQLEKLKQRRTRQRENRFWRRSKKPRYNQNRRKIKKRKRYSIGKLRSLNKEIKRLESYFKIRKWWWKNFLPNLRAQTDDWLTNVKNQKIREKLKLFSINEIFARNSKTTLFEKIPGAQTLEIGNYDYKPLSLPEALFIRENLSHNTFEPEKILALKNKVNDLSPEILNSRKSPVNFLLEPSLCRITSPCHQMSKQPKNFTVPVSPIPFYAGWDETLRKFVITNRLLSRREAGYKIFKAYSSIPESHSFSEFTHYPLKGMNVATTLYWQVPFTTYDPDQFFALGRDGFAPIGWRRFKLGNTKATTKPIIIKHKTLSSIIGSSSKEKNIQGNNTPILNTNQEKVSTLFRKLETKILNVTTFLALRSKQSSAKSGNSFSNNFESKEKTKSRIYFTQKRNKRIKRHPRSPVSFPSGALINQVLPVHYIYVFYKRDRLPRDRYINRRLRRASDPNTKLASPAVERGKQGKSFAMEQSLFKLTDWTLRKRVKPRKKYHRKRKENFTSSGLTGQTNHPKTILRRKFRQSMKELDIFERQRPLTKPRLITTVFKDDLASKGEIKQSRSQQLEGQLKERYKKRKKNKNIKAKTDSNLRIRQLRRRIQRQVFRPVWRYGPNPGGYVWPGDYFRLELIKAPKLGDLTEISKNKDLNQGDQIFSRQNQLTMNPNLTSALKEETKEPILKKSRKRRKLETWSVQPKKYLLEKHNIRVLRKRLQKSENKIKNLMV